MTLDGKKYIGWQLNSISFDKQLFIVDLGRYSLPAAEAANISSLRGYARVIFVMRKGVTLSKVYSGAEIQEIEQSTNEEGNIVCVVKFAAGSFMRVTASEVIDLLL